MGDTTNPNLEPIEEKDLDLASKFGKVEKPAEGAKSVENPAKIETISEREPAKEIISAEKEDTYSKILAKVKSAPVQDENQEEIKDDAKKTFEKQDAESQVQHLVDIALNKGVVHAVKVAKHMEDNYVLDMFHDRMLGDELHEALLRKGLLEEI